MSIYRSRLLPVIFAWFLPACGFVHLGLGTFNQAEEQGVDSRFLLALLGSSSGTYSAASCADDALNFQTATAAEAQQWNAITYGGGLFVAVAYGSDRVMTSPDGINWTARAGTEANQWYGLTYGNNLFMAT